MDELIEKIENILNIDNIPNSEKRKKLNLLEKENIQVIFIKTHLCPACSRMEIEVWIKQVCWDVSDTSILRVQNIH